jgi:hypothetical protein
LLQRVDEKAERDWIPYLVSQAEIQMLMWTNSGLKTVAFLIKLTLLEESLNMCELLQRFGMMWYSMWFLLIPHSLQWPEEPAVVTIPNWWPQDIHQYVLCTVHLSFTFGHHLVGEEWTFRVCWEWKRWHSTTDTRTIQGPGFQTALSNPVVVDFRWQLD